MVSRTMINDTIASITGANRHSIDRNGLVLQKAGIIKSKGRGRNAEAMSYRDATNIILALVGAQTPKESQQAVETLGNLVDDSGEKFADALERYIKTPEDICLIRVNRSYPEAWIIFYKLAEDEKVINWEHKFRDPNNTNKPPTFQIYAQLDTAVFGNISSLIELSM